MIEKPMRFGDALLTPATLMRPEQVRDAMAARKLPKSGQGPEGWFLCGDVSAPMFAIIAGERVGRDLNVAAFTKERAGNYVVFTQQTGMFQHRFVLPLFEPPVPEFVHSLRDAPMQVSMGDAGREMTAVSSTRLPWTMIAPVVQMVQAAADIDDEEVVLSIQSLITRVCDIDTIPSLHGQPPVRDLSVSVLLPTHTLGRVKRSLGEQGLVH